jgi:hypothetical protein
MQVSRRFWRIALPLLAQLAVKKKDALVEIGGPLGPYP